VLHRIGSVHTVNHSGRLLVATPLIADPTFERTVVLLLAHGPDGAFGVVLNRPSDTTVSEVAPAWAPMAEVPGVVFVGGPVARDSVLGLGRPATAVPGAALLPGGCATVDLHRAPGDGEGRWSSVRLFAGSAGWAAGQLEDEVAEGAWWSVDAHPSDLLTAQPDALWARVLRRQGGEVAWFALHPDDPSQN
jgi:putative transcriptional regulator